MGAQSREDFLDVVNGEHDATYAQRVHFRLPFTAVIIFIYFSWSTKPRLY
jgi:hypothetical protein